MSRLVPEAIERLRTKPSAWIAALALLTGVRLIVAGLAPLSPDEAYYWVWSRVLAPGYLDHPPMVALWVRAGTVLASETPLGVRLLGPLSAALGSVLLARAADDLLPGRGAGLRAAALLNATLLLGVGAVTMTPDTPLLLFWTAALWASARLLRTGRGGWWLAVGAAGGLALASKYTAALLGIGVALWLLHPSQRRWLRTPWPWAGGVLALLLFAPVIAWNAGNGWASFAKQGGRVNDWAPGRALTFEAELLGGQAGLATPLVFVLCVAGCVTAARRLRDPAWALLAALTLPGAAVFAQHALGDRVQGNWPAVLYPAACVAAAGLGVGWAGRLRRPAVALGLALTALVYVQAVLAPLALPRHLDVTLVRLAGWDALARDAALLRAPGDAFLAAEDYGLASLLAFHQPGLPVLGAEERWAGFSLPPPSAVVAGQPGLLVLSTRRREPPDPALWLSATEVGPLTRGRGGVTAEEYRVYRVVPREGAAIRALPRPGDG